MSKNDKPFSIRVECYAGYKGEESPRRFYIHDRKVEIMEIVDRWLAPDHRYFKVRGDDNAMYIIRHDVFNKGWEMTLFDSGQNIHPTPST
jgi:hypothetical protein